MAKIGRGVLTALNRANITSQLPIERRASSSVSQADVDAMRRSLQTMESKGYRGRIVATTKLSKMSDKELRDLMENQPDFFDLYFDY